MNETKNNGPTLKNGMVKWVGLKDQTDIHVEATEGCLRSTATVLISHR